MTSGHDHHAIVAMDRKEAQNGVYGHMLSRPTRFLSFQSVTPFDFRALSKEDVQKIWAELSEPIQITGEDCKAKVFYSHAEDRAVTKGFTVCSVVLSNHYTHEEFLFEVPLAFCRRLASNADWRGDHERFVKCSCGEAAIMLLKAALFGHLQQYREIASSMDPAEIKTLGGEVEGFHDDTWFAHLPSVALEADWQKFTKVPRLGQYLVNLPSQYEYIMEYTKNDGLWGTGLDLSVDGDNKVQVPQTTVPCTWRNKRRNDEQACNILGWALGEVRRKMREELANGSSRSLPP